MLRLIYPGNARRFFALTALLTTVGCGGGGALLPTEAGGGDDNGGVDGGAGGGDNSGGGDGGGTDGGGTGGGGTGGGGQAPVTVTISVMPGEDGGFSPGTVTVPVGSTVVWQMVDEDHDVTFDGAAPSGGNIGETDEDESASRVFTQPGTYTYHCAEHADDEEEAHSGTVVVTDGTGGGGGDGGGDDGGGEPTNTASVRTVGDTFSPRDVTIAAGGSVAWTISGDDHNVTFTGTAPTGGNIPTTASGTHTRTFPNAGRFEYLCTRHSGMTGAVTVQ